MLVTATRLAPPLTTYCQSIADEKDSSTYLGLGLLEVDAVDVAVAAVHAVVSER